MRVQHFSHNAQSSDYRGLGSEENNTCDLKYARGGSDGCVSMESARETLYIKATNFDFESQQPQKLLEGQGLWERYRKRD